MELRNYTPFTPFFIIQENPKGQQYGVLTLKGTFALVDVDAATDATTTANVLIQKKLQGLPDQEPMRMTDEHRDKDDVLGTSLLYPSDLVPAKVNTDILINAVAHAPKGKPAERWPVRVQIGQLDHTLQVTGPRAWHYEDQEDGKGKAWQLSDPEPCTEVPLHYEYAFGGIHRAAEPASEDAETEEEPPKIKVCEENPMGKGFVSLDGGKDFALDEAQPIPAPQIEDPEEPVKELGKAYVPKGIGPIARTWQPRLKLAGTYDDAWKEKRWPKLPEDFDFAHHNTAHPDLIYPGFLKGDETVTLSGMCAQGDVVFDLPGYKLVALQRMFDGKMVPVPMMLDTLCMDLVEEHVVCTWRSYVESEMRVLEARIMKDATDATLETRDV